MGRHTAFKDDGSVSGGGGGVYLPFSVETGYEYTLSVSFVRASGTWVAAGFAGGSATSANRLAENQGRGWGLAQSAKVSAFRGPNTQGVAGPRRRSRRCVGPGCRTTLAGTLTLLVRFTCKRTSRRAPPRGIRPPRVRSPGSERWPRCSAHAGGTGLTGRRLGMPPIQLLGPPHWGCIQSLATGWWRTPPSRG